MRGLAEAGGVDGSMLRIGSSGDTISFALTDGVARNLRVSASSVAEMTTTLGIDDAAVNVALQGFDPALMTGPLNMAQITLVSALQLERRNPAIGWRSCSSVASRSSTCSRTISRR